MDLFFEAVDRNIADDRDKRDVLECMLIPQTGEAQGNRARNQGSWSKRRHS